MDVRARAATFLSRSLGDSELRIIGFAPRHLKRYAKGLAEKIKQNFDKAEHFIDFHLKSTY